MKVKVLKTGVTVENAILDIGAVVDMSEKDATRLSGYGLVEVVDEPEPEPEPEPELSLDVVQAVRDWLAVRARARTRASFFFM